MNEIQSLVERMTLADWARLAGLVADSLAGLPDSVTLAGLAREAGVPEVTARSVMAKRAGKPSTILPLRDALAKRGALKGGKV